MGGASSVHAGEEGSCLGYYLGSDGNLCFASAPLCPRSPEGVLGDEKRFRVFGKTGAAEANRVLVQ